MIEFNLSEKVYPLCMVYGEEEYKYRVIDEEDVKEFIELIKDGLGDLIYKNKTTSEYNDDVIRLIDKLAGDKLVESKQ